MTSIFPRTVTGVLVFLAFISVSAQKAAPPQKKPASKVQASVVEKKWIFQEDKDPMNDVVSHSLVVIGTTLSGGNQSEPNAFIDISCEASKPRRVLVYMATILTDSQPEFRFDKEPASTEHWFMPEQGAKNYYKDDSVVLPAFRSSRSTVAIPNPANGADEFVARISQHTSLLIRASSFDNAPKLVSFDISGLSRLLAEHGCPVIKAQ